MRIALGDFIGKILRNSTRNSTAMWQPKSEARCISREIFRNHGVVGRAALDS